MSLQDCAGKRLIAYLRVSTEYQVVNGAGLDVQTDEITTTAEAARCPIVAWYGDEGVSGKENIETRVGLGEAIAALRAGDGDALIVYRVDRLARDMFLQEQLLREIWTAGADVLSCSAAESEFLVRDDPKDPSRKLIRQVLGAVGEYERAMITMRMRAGAERKKAAGSRYAFGGRPPYGWRAEHKELVPFEDEQQVLRWIHELHEDGLSNRAIAAQLNHERLLRRGTQWHHEQVRRALAHPLPEREEARS